MSKSIFSGVLTYLTFMISVLSQLNVGRILCLGYFKFCFPTIENKNNNLLTGVLPPVDFFFGGEKRESLCFRFENISSV